MIYQLVIILGLFFSSCNSIEANKKHNETSDGQRSAVTRIDFYAIPGFTSTPGNLGDKMTILSIDSTKILKLNEWYSGDSLIKVDTLSNIPSTASELKILNSIPERYLAGDQHLGKLNVADEGSLGVTIYLTHGKQIFWKMGYDEKQLPSDLRPIYKIYKKYW